MSIGGLQWQTWTLALGAGQNQKSDPRALQSPELARAIDVQFEEVGGLQTRYPFASVGDEIFGGGVLANIRRVEANGSELVCFSDDTIYSLGTNWIERAEHLAIASDEFPVFQTTDEQSACDRAELGGVVFYSWSTTVGSNVTAYVAAADAESGTVIMSPQVVGISGLSGQTRLVAASTVVFLFYIDGSSGDLLTYILDPADPMAAITAAAPSSLSTVAGDGFNGRYDVVKQTGQDRATFAARLNPTTSYQLGRVTAAGGLSKTLKARDCSGCIAVCENPLDGSVYVVRDDSNDLRGDLLTSAFVDSTVDTAIASASFPIRNVAVEFRATGSTVGLYWDENASNGPITYCAPYYAPTSASPTTVDFQDAAVASRAFAHDGRVFAWLATDVTSASTTSAGASVFSAQLQNTYLLYGADAQLNVRPHAKAAWMKAGGRPSAGGPLPGVASIDTNVYAWCGVQPRLVETAVSGFAGYTDGNPLDIVFEFDSNRARRCVRLGNTLYVTSALGLLQYDGVGLTEVGFLQFPFAFSLSDGGAGTLDAGDYSYKMTLRWQNAGGDVDRSTTATERGLTLGASKEIDVAFRHFDHTLKRSPRSNISIEMWRTAADPPPDAPFSRVTASTPATATGDNRYIENVPGTTSDTFTDSLPDASLTTEVFAENGDVLQSITPPPCSIIAASDDRVFLAGIAGDPDRVWYSKRRNAGEVVSFNGALTVAIPAEGGAITAMWLQRGVLVVARERALYLVVGQGFGNAGGADGSQNYGVERIPGDVGCESHEAIGICERGAIFKSERGWHLLDNGFGRPSYIGQAFADYDDEPVLAVHAMTSQHQVRAITANRMLVFDTLLEQLRCAEWTVADSVHACMWNGVHTVAFDDAIKSQSSSYSGVDYGWHIETAWIEMPNGCIKVDQFQILGEYRSAHRVEVSCARDHWKDGDGVYFQTKTWTVSPTTVGAREKVKHSPSVKRVEAIKLRLRALGPGSDAVPSGEAAKLTSIAFELGFERGLNRQLPESQRQ